MPKPSNIFLEGNFAPIANEYTLDLPGDFEIHGKIPKDLNGSFYRNGPNPQHMPGPGHHWFFGDGMVHAFHLKRGTVTYRNRYARTPVFEIEKRADRNIFFSGGFNPLAQLQLLGGNIFSLLTGLVREGNADVYTRLIAKANTSVLAFREELYALVESSPPFRLDPQTLDSIGFEKFGAGFTAPFTAHPRIDANTGYLYAFGYRIAGKPRLEYYVINPSGKIVGRTPVDIPYYAMVHDFVITKSYAVLPVFPAVASLAALRRGRLAEWQPEKGAAIYILAKGGDKNSIRRFELSKPCYVYHYANAYEEGKTIVIDAVRYDRLPLMGDDESVRGELYGRENNGRLTRFRLDLESGKVDETPLNNHLCEFPQIDPRLTGDKHELAFAGVARDTTEGGFFDSMAAFQISRGKAAAEIFEFPRGHYGGEPIFVPTGKVGQSKGYVLNVVFNSESNNSYLGIWDSAHVDRKPVCQVTIPHRIPYGFHGTWRPNRV